MELALACEYFVQFHTLFNIYIVVLLLREVQHGMTSADVVVLSIGEMELLLACNHVATFLLLHYPYGVFTD
jgi:hypothetical protein